MLSLYGIPLLLQLIVPLALVAWQGLGGKRDICGWLMKLAATLLYIAAAHIAGLWVVLPWYTAIVLLVSVGAIGLWQLPTVRRRPWITSDFSWIRTVARAAIATLGVLTLATAAAGRRMPSVQGVDLEFPLRNGTYYVAGGGSVALLNAHLMTLTGERFSAFRGQSYGVDLLKLGPFGFRATGLLPSDLRRYAIFGEPVHAPCSGVVVQAQDGLADMTPPQPDRTRMAGNHVLLECVGVHVLLAHLKSGSVSVVAGEWVGAGRMLGLVGNTGNSNEPHLHIHAQRPASRSGQPLSGDPIPIRFSGRYLVRNDRIARP